MESGEPGPNPRPEWSRETLSLIAEVKFKRIRFWDEQTDQEQQHQQQPAQGKEKCGEGGDGRPKAKRQRQEEGSQENELAPAPNALLWQVSGRSYSMTPIPHNIPGNNLCVRSLNLPFMARFKN